MQLVDPADLPSDLVQAIRDFKFQGTASKVNFALSDLPKFPGLNGHRNAFTGFTNIGPSFDYLEEAFADCLAGRYSRRAVPGLLFAIHIGSRHVRHRANTSCRAL